MNKQFEKELAAFHGMKYAIGVGNGTDAIWLTLMVLGIGAGDEVITHPNPFFATAEAIWITGATAVLVDCDPKTNQEILCHCFYPELRSCRWWRGGRGHPGVRPSSGAATGFIQDSEHFPTARPPRLAADGTPHSANAEIQFRSSGLFRSARASRRK